MNPVLDLAIYRGFYKGKDGLSTTIRKMPRLLADPRPACLLQGNNSMNPVLDLAITPW